MNIVTRGALLGCTVLTAFSSGATYAQTPPMSGVEEIIVTAQRRSERLQDVPVAVTAVKGEALTSLGVTSALDLRIAAPSLNSTNASGTFASSIRGVGSFAFAPAVESPVALYIDGIYIAAPQASEVALNSIESVEVLKGPQGTLFGRNATSGLIQITTATPTSRAKGDFSFEYGNYDTQVLRGYLSGGVVDNLAADIAFTGRRRGDGFGRNITTGADVGDVHHDISVRSKWVWTPSGTTTVTAIGSYWDGRDTIGYPVPYPGKISGFVPGRVGPTNRGWDAESDVNYRKSGWTANGALKISHDFDTVRFLSITAYREGQISYGEDLDYTPFPLASLSLEQRDKQFSQEFQLSSNGTSKLKWTAGLFYFSLSSDYTPQLVDLSGVPGVNGSILYGGKEDGRSYAGYGQASYEIFDNTNLTLGGRYTSETRRDLDGTQVFTIPGVGSFPSAFPNRKDTARRFTYRISLDHRFSDAVLGYISYNTGFKSGGFNAGNPTAAPYQPENLKSSEIGLKTDLLDRHLRLNLAGFYYDYKNLQVQKIDLFSLFLTNGASARVYGLDADFTVVLDDSFSLTGGINWIDTKFKSFPGCPVGAPQGGVPLNPAGDCAGNQLPFAAKFTGSVAANYTTELGSGKLAASANLYYNSGYAFEPDNMTRQDRYAKVGASLKWTTDNGLSLGVYGTNLTNRRTAALATTQASGNVSALWADPRQYGVTVGYKF